ncbi:MAG TPA: hypothetical protein VIX80_00415 [Candidatus Kapabacteria bacterium]
MKHALILALLAFAIPAFAKVNVPSQVKLKFTEAYPLVTKVQWSKAGKIAYRADFSVKKFRNSVTIDTGGTIIETRESIKPSTAPTAVKKYMTKHFPKAPTKTATKVTNKKGSTAYLMVNDSTSVILDAEARKWKSVQNP